MYINTKQTIQLALERELAQRGTPTRKELPIYAEKENIVDLVFKNKVIVLTAATGVGKTTQVPQYLLDSRLPQTYPVRYMIVDVIFASI